MELNDDELEFLRRKIRGFTEIPGEHLEEITGRFESRVFGKREYLLKEGETCNFWGFIQRGLIRSYSLDDGGEEYTIGCVPEENFITESLSFFRRMPSSVNIHALEETVLICISFEKLQQLFVQFPEFERLARKIYEERLATIKSRLLFRVQLDATERYRYLLKMQPELVKRVPLKYIASYLGITDSTLSRVRRKIRGADA